jgi:hypothetical protein
MAIEGEPLTIIEAKLSETSVSSSLRYFHKKYGFRAVQMVKRLRQERLIDGIELRRGTSFLKGLKL